MEPALFLLHTQIIFPQQPRCKYFLASRALPWAGAGCFPLQILWLPSELRAWVILILNQREFVRRGELRGKNKKSKKTKPQTTRGGKRSRSCAAEPRSARGATGSGFATERWVKRWRSRGTSGRGRPWGAALPVRPRRRGRGAGAGSPTGRAWLGVPLGLLPWLLFLPPKRN